MSWVDQIICPERTSLMHHCLTQQVFSLSGQHPSGSAQFFQDQKLSTIMQFYEHKHAKKIPVIHTYATRLIVRADLHVSFERRRELMFMSRLDFYLSAQRSNDLEATHKQELPDQIHDGRVNWHGVHVRVMPLRPQVVRQVFRQLE